MRMVRCDRVEDCFDGSSVWVCGFDQPWTEPGVRGLAALGRVEYFADFPRPFFRVLGEDGLQIKGVAGETTCRVVLPGGPPREARGRVERLFSGRESVQPAGERRTVHG